MANYRRLAEKHKTLVEKANREKVKLAKAHATELVKVQEELDQETRGYTDYRLDVAIFMK
jgi:predicted transcriptional regulator